MSPQDLVHLLGFEKFIFRIKDNALASHVQELDRCFPYLSNSYNIFREIFDLSPFELSQSKREIDMQYIIENMDTQQLFTIVRILEKQRPLLSYLQSYPLYREKIATLRQFDVGEVTILLDKAKIVLRKLTQIYNFEAFDADPRMGLKEHDIRTLIDILMAQYDFIHEAEENFNLFKLIKERTQHFWVEEFSFTGDIPAYRSYSSWIGGISIRPLF